MIFGIAVDKILSRNGFEFVSDKDFALVKSADWRTIYKADLNAQDPLVISFIHIMNVGRSVWNSLQSISSKFFEGEFPHIDKLDDYKVKPGRRRHSS